MDDELAKHMAKLIAMNCVRNTVIEDIHAEGRLSQGDMRNLNIEVCNKLYTFIRHWFDNDGDLEGLMLAMNPAPSDWNEPEDDADFMAAIKRVQGMSDKEKDFIRRLHGMA